MEENRIVADEITSGRRIDQVLADLYKDRFSRSFVQQLIKEASVTVNGRPVKSHYKLRMDDEIFLKVPAAKKLELLPQDIPLDIVYEDDDLIVINKPAGMVVHPAAGNFSDTLVNALLHHCKKLSGINGVLRPGIVHRLDKDTSGLIVAAKTNKAHRLLANQFSEHTVKKEYIAFVKGRVKFDEDQIDAPIGRHSRHREQMAVAFRDDCRDAITVYKVIERFSDFTAVKLYPKTGRTHQLRVHMAYIGHPVISDEIYGTKGPLKRQALHAAVLGFDHPSSGKYMEFQSKLPNDMANMLKECKSKNEQYSG